MQKYTFVENYFTSPLSLKASAVRWIKFYFNSTLQLFRAEGLEVFALGAIYLNGKGFLTPSRLNKSLVRPSVEHPRANRRGRRP